jgi:hypothetical protein
LSQDLSHMSSMAGHCLASQHFIEDSRHPLA